MKLRRTDRNRWRCFSAFQAVAYGLEQTLKVVSVEAAMLEGKLAKCGVLLLACRFLNVNEPEDLLRTEAYMADRSK